MFIINIQIHESYNCLPYYYIIIIYKYMYHIIYTILYIILLIYIYITIILLYIQYKKEHFIVLL